MLETDSDAGNQSQTTRQVWLSWDMVALPVFLLAMILSAFI
jgi:hypothetical protein